MMLSLLKAGVGCHVETPPYDMDHSYLYFDWVAKIITSLSGEGLARP